MKINISDLTPQGQSFKNEALLSIERARELEEQIIENQLPKGFFFDEEDNLMYQPESSGNGEPPSSIYICSRLDVTAFTRDDNNHNHGCLLEFKDIDGCQHTWAMPMELLAGDGTRYREELLSMGLRIAPGGKARQLLTMYIQSSKPLARARCVTQTGWHKNCFTFPDRTIGSMGFERLILQASSTHFQDYAIAGTLDGWKHSVSVHCVGNSRLVFSISIAFASPLVNLLGVENGGFHFRGASSTGKTTALAVAASVWGGKEYIQRWRATTNGIEALAAGHNDALLCLDELSQVDPSSAGEIAYMLANGAGKTRSDQNGRYRKKATWRLIFLSTGETSLADHMIEAGKKAKAGQEVRIIDVPADTHKHGIFEDLHERLNGAAFSQDLMQACAANYGVAARTFIESLVEKIEEVIPLIRKVMDEFLLACTPQDSNGQVHRVAKRFAIVAAAGELATAFGITGWNPGEASCAVKTCFSDWLSARGGSNVSQEELSILSQVRRFFEQHGESRFTPWDAQPEHKTINRVGFRKLVDDGMEYFVLPETFKSEVATGFDHRLVSKICLKRGLLVPGNKGEPTRSERLPNYAKSTRCYRFSPKVLGEEVENDE
jgi:putative DNA primase/helicase